MEPMYESMQLMIVLSAPVDVTVLCVERAGPGAVGCDVPCDVLDCVGEVCEF